ncbi:TetR/AcrR family transcriptional regulator [Actinokineospora sp. G85]|uniref:TetR/AcrR family transcriptional regulator n=1 Tax=Actinokineospora sp. G85 TaxID=3406626 RepID=UPI003C747838
MTDPAEAAPPRRRTQRERREATVGKLVDATIAAISEVGYARTSVQEICRRAGVSHGGLFRHFETRLDLVVTAAEEVGRRLLAHFWERVGPVAEQTTALPSALPEVLRAIRAACRSPLNLVWFEILVAARTDATLRDRLIPTIDSFWQDIYLTALRIPVIAAQPVETRQAAVAAALHMFEGETFINSITPRPEIEDKMLAIVSGLYAPPGV